MPPDESSSLHSYLKSYEAYNVIEKNIKTLPIVFSTFMLFSIFVIKCIRNITLNVMPTFIFKHVTFQDRHLDRQRKETTQEKNALHSSRLNVWTALPSHKRHFSK